MNLKRIFIQMMTFLFVIGMFSAYVSAEREAMVNTEQNNIYISGRAQDADVVTILMKNKADNTVAYIREMQTDDGDYSFKFKFNDDYNNYNLYVMDGDKNITDTVMSTKAETLYPAGEITRNKFSDNGDTADISAYIENKYNDEGNAKVIVSWFNENNAMVSCDIKDISYDYYSGNSSWTVDVPDGAVRAKVFIWSSINDCIPLSKSSDTLPNKNVILVGASMTQAYDASSCRKGWGEYIGNYMVDGANVINDAHAGWDSVRFIYDEAGWSHAKSLIKDGDIVIFNIGYNDHETMGYNGEYCTEENGVRTYYKYRDNTADGTLIKTYELIDNSVTVPEVGTLKYDSRLNLDVYREGMLTYLYEDAGGNLQSYAADSFYDNMKIMLDDCRELGAEVILTNVAAVCSKTPQDKNSGTYHAYRTHAIIGEKCLMLDEEYDNVTAVDLFTETKNHYAQIYNSAQETADYFFDKDGNKYPYIRDDGKLQQLADKYWLTVRSYNEFYKYGQITQNSNGVWGYLTTDGRFLTEDTLHFNSAGANYVASAVAKVIKNSDSPVSEYIK